MKVLIFGKDKNKIYPLVKKIGFEIVRKNPEIVLSYGGDGTFIKSEFEFPRISKVILKNSRICKNCSKFSNEEVLKRIKQKKFIVKKLWKLEATVKNKTLRAINDVVVHNKNPRHGVRYEIYIDGKKLGNEIIGDGVVVATSFGSTAYYRSITGSFFETGIGLAFNNSTEPFNHVVLKESREIRLKVIRGPAIVYADNQIEIVNIDKGDEVFIKKSSKIAKILSVD
jgi:NAD kinase